MKYGEMFFGMLAGFLGMIFWVARNSSWIRRCERCGRLICSLCTRSNVLGNQCSQCVNAFTTRDAVDPQVVRQKRSEVAKYQGRRRVWLQGISLLLPGIGHLLRGRAYEGIILFFIFSLFVTRILWGPGWAPSPIPLNGSWDFFWMTLGIFLFAIYYFIVQYRMNRYRPKGGKYYFRPS